MNYKLISIASLAAIATASQAQIVLTGVSTPNGGSSSFGSGSFATSYSGSAGVVTVNKTAGPIPGAVSGWIFDAHALTGDVTTLTFTDSFIAGTVKANSQVKYTVEADFIPAETIKGPTFLSGGGPTASYLNILSQPGYNPITDTLTFTIDLTSFHDSLWKISVDQDFKNVGVKKIFTPEPASMATVGFGLAALFVRRRRKNA